MNGDTPWSIGSLVSGSATEDRYINRQEGKADYLKRLAALVEARKAQFVERYGEAALQAFESGSYGQAVLTQSITPGHFVQVMREGNVWPGVAVRAHQGELGTIPLLDIVLFVPEEWGGPALNLAKVPTSQTGAPLEGCWNWPPRT